ncbi:MAG: polyprenyl synthetase family protein [Mogibacterium sp.]|nr:polyprenyl synthetase family protein [Mogibacterium sp.]
MLSFDEYKALIEDNLLSFLPDTGVYAEVLKESMGYSLSIGGKRIRPVLLLASCDLAGGDVKKALPYACAVEFIHTYSLIHDDLPAMDDDDMRRGKPSNHKVYGEAMAILAGDGLLNSAAELIAKQALSLEGDADALYAHSKAAHEILSKAGASGMIAGQTADVISEKSSDVSEDLISFIELHKTSDLIAAPTRAGLMLANAADDMIEAFTTYALDIGVGFQILDDILDIEGDEKLLGKTLGKDSEQGKCNYASVHGLEKAKEDLHKLTVEAKESISKYDSEGFFTALASQLESRKM